MRRINILQLLLCFAFVAVQAQQSKLLETYRQMALDYNPDLKAAEKNIAASIELESMAKADLKPHLQGAAQARYTGNPSALSLDLPIMDQPIGFEGKHAQYGATVSLLQPIYTGGRLLETIKMAQQKQSFAINQKQVVRSVVCYQTDIQYWNTVARAELITVAEDYQQAIVSLVETIKARVEVGLVDPQDLLMAEVKLNEANYQLLQAKDNYEIGRMALNSMIGLGLNSNTEIEQSVPVVSESDPMKILEADTRAEIKMELDRINIEKSLLKLNDSKYKPQLHFGVDGSYSSPGYNFKSDLDPNYAVYAKLSVPIFEWGKRKSEKRASTQRIGMATDQLQKVEDAVQLEVASAQVSLTQALQRVNLVESSLEKAYENEKKAVERYAEGKISIVEVINAQAYRQTAQINFTQAKVAAQGSYAALLKAMNSVVYQ